MTTTRRAANVAIARRHAADAAARYMLAADADRAAAFRTFRILFGMYVRELTR